MIKNDRKIIKAVLKLTDNYHDELTLDGQSALLIHIHNYREVLNSIPVKMSREDAIESIERLLDNGFLRKYNAWSGGYSFTMTSLLKHRHAFWWDRFTTKFIGGFVLGLISGIIVTVIGGLLLAYIRLKVGI